MAPTDQNAELNKFSDLAATWWDPEGPMRALHDINGPRTDYIDRRAPLSGRRVLDVGCGAGVLTEALAHRGATATGIDLATKTIEAAREHAADQSLEVTYRDVSTRDLAGEAPESFDIVVAYEMLEHVDAPAHTVEDCARLCKPGGHLFFSTINRTAKSWLFAIVGAEYVLRLLPRGTHEHAKLVRPGELAGWCRNAGLRVEEITGMHYNPVTRGVRFGGDTGVNYFMHVTRPDVRS